MKKTNVTSIQPSSWITSDMRQRVNVNLDVGATISHIRKKLGVSQVQLADMVGISQGYLSQIENGTRDPSFESLTEIAEALNFPIEFIIYMSHQPNEKRLATNERLNAILINTLDTACELILDEIALESSQYKDVIESIGSSN